MSGNEYNIDGEQLDAALELCKDAKSTGGILYNERDFRFTTPDHFMKYTMGIYSSQRVVPNDWRVINKEESINKIETYLKGMYEGIDEEAFLLEWKSQWKIGNLKLIGKLRMLENIERLLK